MHVDFSLAIKANFGELANVSEICHEAVSRGLDHKRTLFAPSGCAVNEAISVTNGVQPQPMEKKANGVSGFDRA